MNRRAFLAAVDVTFTGALAGCLARGGYEWSGREVALTHVGDVADEAPLRPDVELVSARMDGTETPELEIALKNTAEEPVGFVYGGTEDRLFPDAVSSPGALQLVTDQRLDRVGVDRDHCWSVEGEFRREDVANVTTIEPGATASQRVVIVAIERRDAPCPDAGTYSFSSTYDLEWEASTAPDWDSASIDWRFHVEIPRIEEG